MILVNVDHNARLPFWNACWPRRLWRRA